MLFNSHIFIFLLLPVCIAGYYILQGRQKNLAKSWVILCSLCFYGYYDIRFLLLLVLSVLATYGICKWLQKETNSGLRKWILALGVLVNLLPLLYFKYTDFFLTVSNQFFKTKFSLLNLALPLGISFFTFQQIFFIADYYRKEEVDCSFIDYLQFAFFFPKMAQGPIVTQKEMMPQLAAMGEKKAEASNLVQGICSFVLGLAKKMLLADTFGRAVEFGYSDILALKSLDAVIVILSYTFQLYFDFSGYCDMADGISRMLGITLPLNFNSPYKAYNIIDFWKRWHITLTRFFTRNVYIPLGGNRRGKIRMYCNFLLVFLLSGFWHGAGFTFVLWGLMHGVLYLLTKMWYERFPVKDGEKTFFTGLKKCVGVTGTFLFANIAWVYFRSATVTDANLLLCRLFSGVAAPLKGITESFQLEEVWYILKILHLTDFSFSSYILIAVFFIVAFVLVFAGKNVRQLTTKENIEKRVMNPLYGIMMAVLFVWCVVSITGLDSFLYVNF